MNDKSFQRRMRWYYMRLKYLLLYQKWDFFNEINIDVNTSCTRRCSYCPNSVYERGLLKNQKLMDENTFKKIIDELAKVKYRGVLSPVHYGEPLLDKRIFRLMAYAKKKLPKATLLIYSNGDCLTPSAYEKLISSGVTKFILTQHGITKSKRLGELFEHIKRNPNKKVRTNFSKFNENTPLLNRGGLVKPKNVLYEPGCIWPNNALVIDVDGNVILCCNDYLSTIKFGNVSKKSLLEIWEDKKYKNIRRDLIKKRFKLSICKKCVGIEK